MNEFDPNLPTGADAKECERWLRKLVSDFGPGFHPDTPAAEYTDAEGKRLPPVITDALESSLDRVFAILGDSRPYEIGIEEKRKLLEFDQAS